MIASKAHLQKKASSTSISYPEPSSTSVLILQLLGKSSPFAKEVAEWLVTLPNTKSAAKSAKYAKFCLLSLR